MISKLFSKIFGGFTMTPEQENLKIMQQIRNDMIEDILKDIHNRIERVCRECSHIVVDCYGFNRINMATYETSIQKVVVDRLTKDGYICKLCTDYMNNNPISYLEVRW